jgi:hypothetical protein
MARPNDEPEALAASLSGLTVGSTHPPDCRRALFRPRKLLSGITVGGHRLSDERLVLNQAKAFKSLFTAIEADRFIVTKEVACALRAAVAFEEALTWGEFRTGPVRIAGTGWVPPDAATLDDRFARLLAASSTLADTHARALAIYLDCAQAQYFWDGNRQAGRLLMNGVLLAAGHDMIAVPARRQLEFNTASQAFYETGAIEPLVGFLLSCSLDDTVSATP